MKSNKVLLNNIVLITALGLSLVAALFSVTGLAMLYSLSIYIIIAMSIIEVAKVVTVSILYQHWNNLLWWLKSYLVSALLIVMIITSGGIYGYLTHKYMGSTIGLDRINSQSQVLEIRKENFVAERERLVSDIATLRSERQSTVENRNNEIATNNMALDSNSVKYRAWRNSQVHKRYNVELGNIDNQVSKYTVDLDSTNVRLSRVNNEFADNKLEMINTGGEVGPLVYMARIFNTSMDNIMKWFSLAIVFVFDPLAIALIIAYNNLVMMHRPPKKGDDWPSIPVNEALIKDDDEFGPVDLEEDEFGPVDLEEDDVIELEPDFVEALDETAKKVGQDEPTKERLGEDIKETPTKDIVAPTEPPDDWHVPNEKLGIPDPETGAEPYPLEKDDTEIVTLDEYDKSIGFEPEQPILESEKLEPEPEPEIEPEGEKLEPEPEPEIEPEGEKLEPDEESAEFNEEEREVVKKKLDDGEIKEYFEDAVKKVRAEQEGKIKKSMFTSGGGIRVN